MASKPASLIPCAARLNYPPPGRTAVREHVTNSWNGEGIFRCVVLVFASLLGLHHAQPAAVAPVAIVQSPGVPSLSVPSSRLPRLTLRQRQRPQRSCPQQSDLRRWRLPNAASCWALRLRSPTPSPTPSRPRRLTNSAALFSRSSSASPRPARHSRAHRPRPRLFQTFATSQKVD